MRHIILSLLLLVACSAMAQTEECKIPVFLSEYGNDVCSWDDLYYSDYQFYYKRPYSPVRSRSGKQLHEQLVDYLNQNGFTTDFPYTRFGVRLRYNDTPNSLELSFSLFDSKNHMDIDTFRIDTVYGDDKIKNIVSSISLGFPYSIPNLDKVIASIRKKALLMFESNADYWIETANKFVAEGNPKKAMYLLSQYPACCQNYPKVRTRIATLFRDYVNKDHDKLVKQARKAWNSNANETEARFVVALLNSQKLSKSDREKAENILNGVALYYPTLDINAHEDYTSLPELAEVAVQLANEIGKNYK